jgi:site-specific recombinase XerD
LTTLSRYFKASPATLTTAQFKSYLAYRVQQENVSVSTVNQLIGAWRLLQVDVLGKDPESIRVKRPNKEKKLPTVLSRSEALQLINASPNLKHRTMITLAYVTGLRRDEVLNLKIQDIDSSRHQIRVANGKGHKQRMVPVTDHMIDLLRQYYKSYRPGNYLFEGLSSGKKYSETSFRNIVNKAAQRAGIRKKISPHTLRHSFATHMLEKGMNLKRLQMILGHNAMKTTAVYLHVTNTGTATVPDLLESDSSD